jgi:hypothetical protein
MNRINYTLDQWELVRGRDSIPCSDTFHFPDGRIVEEQVARDILNSKGILRYHVNCAQSRDLGFLIDNLLKNKKSLEGGEIEVVATTILEYSLNRINIDHADHYRRQIIDPIKRMNLRVIQMDNENPDHRGRFLARYNGVFNGTMCNIGGATLEPLQTAKMLIQTTVSNGWIQTDNEWILRRLIKRKTEDQRICYHK